MISNMIIPLVVLLVVFYGFKKGVNIYDEFLLGVKEGLDTSLKLFPVMFSMMLCIDVLVKSNIIGDFVNKFVFLFDFLKFPKELFMLGFMRPISGSSSLVLLNDILKNIGPDSYVGRIGSVIQGSTDTTIYIIGLYFSSIGIKKIKYSLIVGIITDIVAIILSVVVINILFY